VQLVGGRSEGPRVKAALQTVAGDWITNRTDGSSRLDVRLTLKTDDGALILVTYTRGGASLMADWVEGVKQHLGELVAGGSSHVAWELAAGLSLEE
jgi:hypothetical protein